MDTSHVFDVSAQTAAEDYTLALPPVQAGGLWTPYEDIEWATAVKLPGNRVRYLRYAVAALPQAASLWPRSLRSAASPLPAGGISGLAIPPAFGRWPSDLVSMQANLERFAAGLERTVMRQGASQVVSASGPH